MTAAGNNRKAAAGRRDFHPGNASITLNPGKLLRPLGLNVAAVRKPTI